MYGYMLNLELYYRSIAEGSPKGLQERPNVFTRLQSVRVRVRDCKFLARLTRRIVNNWCINVYTLNYFIF